MLRLAFAQRAVAGSRTLWSARFDLPVIRVNGSNIRLLSSLVKPFAGSPWSIVFGSQTGTAQMFAELVGKELRKKGLTSVVYDAKDIVGGDLSAIKPKNLVIITSCYGEGEPPDNFRSLFKWINTDEAASKRVLSDVRFMVFGLGNSKCFPDRYQIVGKKVDEFLPKLGAQRILNRAEGDDSGDIDGDFEDWLEKVTKCVMESEALGPEPPQSTSHSSTSAVDNLDRKFIVNKPVSDAAQNQPRFSALQRWEAGESPDSLLPYVGTLASAYELSTDPSYKCRSMMMDFRNIPTQMKYKAGDHLGVFPQNDPFTVEMFCRLFKIPTSKQFSLQWRFPENVGGKSIPIPGVCTVQHALENFLDITASPPSSVLKEIAGFVSSPGEKAELMSLATEKYTTEIKNTNFGWMDIVRRFPSLAVQWEDLVEFLPLIKPRFYSISSSGSVNPCQVRISTKLVEYRSSSGLPLRGLCSGFLHNVEPGDSVPMFVRPSTFHLPSDHKRPVIMIGAGTGIAPFIGFLEERHHYKEIGSEMGPAFLFFGCRDPRSYMYRDVLEAALSTNVLSELNVAYSKPLNNLSKPKFVHECFDEYSEDMYRLVAHHNAHVYVCGGASGFGESIRHAIRDLFCKYENLSEEDSFKKMSGLISDRRYFEDLAD